MKKKKEIILFKPNELIELTNRKVSLAGFKAYNMILHILRENKTNKMTIPLNELIIDNNRNYEELYNYLDELQKVQVKSIDKRGKTWGGFVLISAFKRTDEGVYIEIPNLIADQLFKTEGDLYYTPIKLLDQSPFKCSYSIVFSEIFKKYEKIEIPRYSLEILRELTETKDKYKVYADFKKRVLMTAIKEINSLDDKWEYSFEEIKTGRKITSIQFLRNKKAEVKEVLKAEIVEEIPMSDKLLNAIKKAKKSLYVQSAYSQKAMDKLIKKYDEKLIIKALGEVAKYNQEIKSFLSIMTSKIEDLKNSSNKALDEKMEKREKGSPNLPKDEIQLQENDVVSDEVEHLKKLLHHQAKDQGKLSSIMESMIKACKTKSDVEMIANNLKIELNLELF